LRRRASSVALRGLAIDSTNGKLYWSEFRTSGVVRMDLDGSTQEELISGGVGDMSGIALDVPNGKMYMIVYNNTAIYSANLDGTDVTAVATGLGGQGVGIAVDSSTQKLYYALRNNDIYVMNTDGTDPGVLLTGQTVVTGLALDVAGGKIYWVAAANGMIRRADLADGGNIEDVSSTNGNAWHMAFMPAP